MVPVAQVGRVASQIVQLVPVVPVVLVVLVVPVDPEVLVDLVVPVDPVVRVAVAPVHVQVREEQRLVRLDGQEANLHVAVNLKGPSVKSLTTWKHLRWVEYVCLEEMATVSDFHVVPA